MSETIADIVREMREGFNMSWHDVDREWAHDLADRIEAADAMEREKMYEYSLRTSSGHSVPLIPTTEEQARRHMIPGDRLIRREVGEWEEVKE